VVCLLLGGPPPPPQPPAVYKRPNFTILQLGSGRGAARVCGVCRPVWRPVGVDRPPSGPLAISLANLCHAPPPATLMNYGEAE
jgi:hypothetical protein